MKHTDSRIDRNWEQLRICFQRLEWMAESRGLRVEELLDANYPWSEKSEPISLAEQRTMARLRALVYKANSN